MDIISRLAQHAAGLKYDSLTKSAVHQIKRAVLDRIGCAFGAWRVQPYSKLVTLIRNMGGADEATIWFDGNKVPAPYAALAVGTISSHLDFQSGAEMIPAAFAVGEVRRCNGKALIVALAAGFDNANVVKGLIASGVEAHGLHWPGQLSVYSAATAACKLRNASVEQFENSISLAGCLAPVAPFEAFTKGAQVKDLYAGWGNMLGIVAAQLGMAGFSGPSTLFEGALGLVQAWQHKGISADDLETLFPKEGTSAAEHLSFKPFACCTAAHSALSAIERILDQNPDINIDDISTVDVRTYSYAVRLSNESTADTSIAARVSIPYLCAAILMEGVVDAEQTEEPFLNDPRLRNLASRVTVSALPDMDSELETRYRPAHVTIQMHNGKRLSAQVSAPKWGHENPPSDTDLEDKFSHLVGNQISVSRQKKLVSMIWDLESIGEIGEIISYLV